MINNLDSINDLYLVNLSNVNCDELTTATVNNNEFNQLQGIFTNMTIQEQINSLTGDLTGGYNDRITKIENYIDRSLPASKTLKNELDDIHTKNNDQQIEIDSALTDIGVLDASVTAIEVDISTRINGILSTHTAEIGTINENLTVLNDKTQNISSLLTTTGTTTYENSNIIINNGVSNQIELKKDSQSVFNQGIVSHNNINIDNGKSIISDNLYIGNNTNDANINLDGYCNIKKDIQMQNNQKIIGGGTLTIDSGSTTGSINIGSQFDTINLNGLLVNVNAIFNGGYTFQQF